MILATSAEIDCIDLIVPRILDDWGFSSELLRARHVGFDWTEIPTYVYMLYELVIIIPPGNNTFKDNGKHHKQLNEKL